MAAAVSSSSPISLLSSGTVTSPVGGPTSESVPATGVGAEVSDFVAVLSPLMGSGEAGVTVVPATLLTPETALATAETPMPALPSALPEGLELTAVLQQAAANSGNLLPANGKVLPDATGDVAADTDGDLTAQLVLPATVAEPDTALPADAMTLEQPAEEGEGEELLAELELPMAAPVVDAAQATSETMPTPEHNDADASVQPQVLLPAAASQLVAQPVPVADAPGTHSSDTDPQLAAATPLPPNSRPVSQRSEMAPNAAFATQPLESADAPVSAEQVVSDLLSASPGSDANDDPIKSAGFGRLLEAQATSSNTGQQPLTDTAAIGSKMLTGAVAYRMDGNTQVATALVNQPVDTPQWSNEIGERVVWFGANKIQHAEIELDPPELGPLQVRISTQNDQTSVTFTSHHAAVRDVLDQSLPRLKEMFSEQGLNLVQADVGEHRGAPQQQQFEAQDSAATSDSAGDDESNAGAVTTTTPAKMRLGLVDAYA